MVPIIENALADHTSPIQRLPSAIPYGHSTVEPANVRNPPIGYLILDPAILLNYLQTCLFAAENALSSCQADLAATRIESHSLRDRATLAESDLSKAQAELAAAKRTMHEMEKSSKTFEQMCQRLSEQLRSDMPSTQEPHLDLYTIGTLRMQNDGPRSFHRLVSFCFSQTLNPQPFCFLAELTRTCTFSGACRRSTSGGEVHSKRAKRK